MATIRVADLFDDEAKERQNAALSSALINLKKLEQSQSKTLSTFNILKNVSKAAENSLATLLEGLDKVAIELGKAAEKSRTAAETTKRDYEVMMKKCEEIEKQFPEAFR